MNVHFLRTTQIILLIFMLAISGLGTRPLHAQSSPPTSQSFLGLAGDGTTVNGLWEGATDYRVALRGVGRVRAVMLFAHFPDTTREETTADLYERLVPGGIAFFQRASYGKMQLEVDAVHHWIPMDHPTTWPGYDCSKFETHKGYLTEVITKAAERVKFRDYDIVYVVGSLGPGLPNSPTFSAPPGQGVPIQGQEIRHAVTFGRDIRSDRWGWQTLAHETGHICGLPDLYRFGAPAKPYKGIHVYVGAWDLMGFQAPGSEYLAWQKRKLEWLTDQDFAIITQKKGSQEIWLTPIDAKIDTKIDAKDEKIDSGADRSIRKALVVPISPTEAYVAEVRRRDDLPDTGLLLYRVSLKTASGHGPIQIIPAAPDDEDPIQERRYITLYNALYHDGLVLDDPQTHIRIEIVGRREGAIRVRVTGGGR